MCSMSHVSPKATMLPHVEKYAGVILLLIVLPAICHAQQPAVVTARPGIFYGSVDGYVLSAVSNTGIPGAKVWLVNASRENVTYGTAGSDRKGHYYFLDVAPMGAGAYRVKAQSGNDTGITDAFGVSVLENKTINVSVRTSPYKVSIAAPRSYVVANGSDHITLTASVMGSRGNPVGSGYPFTYTIRPYENGAFIGSIGIPGPLQTVHSIATDSDGQVKIDYGWVKSADAGKYSALKIYYDADPRINSSMVIASRAADTMPPSTFLSISGIHDNVGGYVSNVTAMLATRDNPGGWGVNSTYYRMDDGNWVEYNGPFIITGDGAVLLEYYSVDRAGNAEKPHRQTILIHQSV